MNELWSLLNFIEPTTFSSEADFINRFGNLTDANQVASLHSLLRPFFLRRVKSDVEKNIPPKVDADAAHAWWRTTRRVRRSACGV